MCGGGEGGGVGETGSAGKTGKTGSNKETKTLLEKVGEKYFLTNFIFGLICRWCRVYKARCHARKCLSGIPSLPPLLPITSQLVAERRLLGETLISRGPLEIGEEKVAEFLEHECFDLEEKR